ncbi:MAG: RNA repair domain-containing protein [Candidatus Thermoplasmatota archaeon]|nr:RNA repair domain-containing protein [Candidatus Thermoplasmatota archaeon]
MARHKTGTVDGEVMTLHEVLSQLEWGDGVALKELEFLVIDRGAPDDRRVLAAPEVEGRDRSYLHLGGGGRVPYHRVLEVRSAGRVLWRRETGGTEEGP